MPDNIVQGLFGFDPMQIQQRQNAQIDQAANNYANQNPIQQANAMMFRGAANMTGGLAGMMGLQNPQMQEAQAAQAIMRQIDPSTAEGLMRGAQLANQAGQPKLAYMLAQAAQKRKMEETDLALKQAHARYYDTTKQGTQNTQLAAKQAIARRDALKRGYAAGLSGQELDDYVQQQVDIITKSWNETVGGGSGGGAIGTPTDAIKLSEGTSVDPASRFSADDLAAMRKDAADRGDTNAVAAIDMMKPTVQLKPRIDVIKEETTAREKAKAEAKPKAEELTLEGKLVLHDMVINSRFPVGWGRLGMDERNKFLNGEGKQRYSEGGSGESIALEQVDAKARGAALTDNTKKITSLKPFIDMVDANGEILKGLAKKSILTNVRIANKSLNWLREHAGDYPDTAEFLAQMKIFKDEAARVVSNPNLVGVMTDTARKEMEAVIDGNMPLNATIRVIERLQQDSHIRLDKLNDENERLKNSFKKKRAAINNQGQDKVMSLDEYLKSKGH